MLKIIPLIVFAPLVGAVFNGLFCRILSKSQVSFVGCILMSLAAVLSWLVFFYYEGVYHILMLPWIDVGSLKANWAIYVDELTIVMFVVVNTVSALVHIYSVGYMSNDEGYARFFSYLSLFTFCMLVLVSSDNFLQLFLGWEGVGVCSYLLIGFWFKKNTANFAAMKAFVVNRIGDFGLLLGICAVFVNFGSVEFSDVAKLIDNEGSADVFGIDTICLLLFVGCMGKSAQMGLHTWLPDAMEGPTPVSALIHAATMVTAGVFLVARCHFMFAIAPLASEVMMVLGAITSVFAASIAVVQTDIKKIIAYSTCSQLGYMFMACGSLNYTAAIFHLATHAFFKALLFLGAGSIIYSSHHEQDIYKLRCNWRDLPIHYAAMWVGSLALAGIFPFAGFYSKDLIINALYGAGSQFVYLTSLIVACLTAVYSWRTIIVVFHNPCSGDRGKVSSLPKVMKMPLFILMFLSCIAGVCGHHLIDSGVALKGIAYGVFWGDSPNTLHYEGIDMLDELKPLILSASGILLVFLISPLIFGRVIQPFRALEASTLAIVVSAFISPWITILGCAIFLIYRFSGFMHGFLLNHWYFNELYNRLFVLPAHCFGHIFWKFFDIKVIDALGPVGVSRFFSVLSARVSSLYTGRVLDYGFYMIFVLALAITAILWL